ncbi:MAG: hypothetical protein ACM31O_00040 [Bacteroidota bacterium]
MKTEITSEAVKAAPPITIMGLAHLSNWTINDVVMVLTGIYVVAQLSYLLWKWRRESRSK